MGNNFFIELFWPWHSSHNLSTEKAGVLLVHTPRKNLKVSTTEKEPLFAAGLLFTVGSFQSEFGFPLWKVILAKK